MKQVLKKLTIAYYLIYVAAIAVAAAGYLFFRSGLVIDPKSQAGIVISSVLIFLIICSIPLTLAIFNRKTKQWAELEDTFEKLRKYTKASIIRLVIIGTDFLLGILFFFLLNSQNMIILAGIAAIALLFCKPAKVKMMAELKINETKE
ncbi:MAG TPA: hypothetical protein PK978_03875 [Paludibacter sp.]|jgi:hypothetical protein|nr:hypothetical protein [Bacteroidales bacterium]HOG05355.1 hypothetical protein [Paludibacter sp.]HOS45300.1 hypothetical protein [Paludibacter sp.]HPM09032.1 hypothetical protein [Paludibacter sp.]